MRKIRSHLPQRSVARFFQTMAGEGSKGFDTIALHGGYTPDTEAVFGVGKKESFFVVL